MFNSLPSSSSSSITLKEGAAVAISSSDISNIFSADFYHLSLAFVFFNKAFAAAHFVPFLKHEIKSNEKISFPPWQ